MWLYAVWGFVGASVNCGIVFAEAVRRVKGWPWTFPHGPGGAPYAAAVVTDLAGGAATSAALSSSDMMTPNILLAFLIGAATPAVLKKLGAWLLSILPDSGAAGTGGQQ
ncbi:hypothetical protein [Nocardia gipuzkoensis]|uniref:hypothetical protein n=1 Tax=Nocardia gipuzkoensis TaxID=2749991 RepID=UPI0015EE6392|nr:hypothetical protein [Nocardia gipuzkoensis]